jgi:Holliday junction resolvasome RuvABC endonuclease subunit
MISAVKKILGLRELPSHLDDSADALAMALTHHYKLKGLAAPKIEIKKKISSASKSRAKLAKVRRKRK